MEMDTLTLTQCPNRSIVMLGLRPDKGLEDQCPVV